MRKTDVVIIGGGISGLSALHYLRTQKTDLNVKLYEAGHRLGGTIGTDHIDGYSVDWGPNGFLDREPLTLELCDQLGLQDKLERANENVSNRFILRKGKLRKVPMSPPAFVKSDILSPTGKLRVFMEPLAKSRPEGVDESVYDFVQRRIGTEAADYLVQPMVSGVYGGVAKKLSLKSCFPIMREMEDEYGSLFKAMISRARQAKKEGRKSGGPSGPGGWLTSFYGGLNVIIERFADRYDDCIVTGAPVAGLSRDQGGYTVTFGDGQTESTRHVVLAIPSYQAAKVVQGISSELSEALSEIPYAPISVVCLGYDESAVSTPLDGFGFLVPQKENRRILGSIWTSSIFADRAPAGKVQFRTMVGGDGDHESMKLTDGELLGLVTRDLSDILGISGEPEFVKMYRWTHGIPQYRVGHSDTMDRVHNQLDRNAGLHIAGNAYYGIGLNDCVKQAHHAVQDID